VGIEKMNLNPRENFNSPKEAADAPRLSIVVPAFNNQLTLRELAMRVLALKNTLGHGLELIFIDDASEDQTWEEVRKLASEYPEIHGYRSQINRGQHYSLLIGMKVSKGDLVVLMDGDLQDPPEQIPDLLNELMAHRVDAVLAIDVTRGNSGAKRLSSNVFHSLFKLLSGWRLPEGAGVFGAYSKLMVSEITRHNPGHTVIPLAAQRSALPIRYLELPRDVRSQGRTSYTVAARLKLARTALVDNSTSLIHFSLFISLGVATLAILGATWIIVGYLTFGSGVAGWSSLAVLILGLGSVSLMSNWILGLYLIKIMDRLEPEKNWNHYQMAKKELE
jgi:glycosyltransferase involved in cell wall biosynthesis